MTSDYLENAPNIKRVEPGTAGGTTSTLFQNLINSRLEAGTAFAGRATPTPQL